MATRLFLQCDIHSFIEFYNIIRLLLFDNNIMFTLTISVNVHIQKYMTINFMALWEISI